MSSTLKSQRLEEPVPPTVSAGRNDIFLGDVVAHVSAPECRCLLSNTTGMRITVAQEEPGRMDANAPAWIINMRYGDRIYRAVYRMVYNAAGPENGFRATLAGCLHPDEPLPFEIALTQRMRISGLKELRGVIPRRDGTFALQPVTNASPLEAGWSLDGKPRDRIALALPLLGFSSAEGNDRVLSIATDPYRGVEYTLSTLETEPGTALLEFTSSFGGDSDPRPSQSRTVLVAAHPDGEAQFLDTFYETISHIEPGPAWVREIRLNYYDYIANVGKALEPDLSALAAKIPESYRRHVLVCLHGYYDYLGRYTFDSKARRLDDQWTSYDNQARPLPMSKVELRRRIRLVKSFGFRCALYF
ncbi:MAG: hypothetical protein K9N51_14105, partial [Candidatus Pacebacteria bacterium]|nr:hypothetical protein [Candidatus Paceibacterota bacterium]